MTVGVELVGLLLPGFEHVVEASPNGLALAVALGQRRRATSQAQPDHLAFAGLHRQPVVGRGLGARLLRVHRVRLAVDDEVVDPVLDVRAAVGHAEDPLRVRLVLGEQQRRIAVAVEVALAQRRVDRLDDAARRGCRPAASVGRSAAPARTTGCGTRASAGRAARPPRGRGCGRVIWIEDVLGRLPWRTRRTRRSSGPRRRRRCRAARTRTRAGSGGGWSRPGRRRGTPPAGTCRGTSCTSASACCRGRSSTP